MAQYGSEFIREENELPDYSVGFWKSDRDLELYQSFNKPRYRYNSNINLPFVGLQEPEKILPKGTLLRYSLTRAFDKDKNGKNLHGFNYQVGMKIKKQKTILMRIYHFRKK